MESFNSILVRLKVEDNHRIGFGQQSFNSILVRLKDQCQCLYWETPVSFNSILVRLKAVVDDNMRVVLPGFQFHSGTIKRGRNLLPAKHTDCFNSILVRLKEDAP